MREFCGHGRWHKNYGRTAPIAWIGVEPTAGKPTNAGTSLIGRAAELALITDFLHSHKARLLTLTGPVGVGKTRLALEVGHQLLPDYQHGVYLVALAAVSDPSLVAAATATALGVRELPGEQLAQAVSRFLVAREMLLIFDNFEHLLPAIPFLAMLLTDCPNLQILVTSQARLHLYGEHELVVTPLAVPESADYQGAADSPAVRLFCARAQAAQASFHLTPSLTPAVVEICRRLDGLPLAVELAATRIKLFSAPELQKRLEGRLSLLSQGPADLPPRQQDLENAIAWSFGLLSPTQRIMLARLAIFHGGFSLEAAEAVCGFHLVSPDSSTADQLVETTPETAVIIAALLDQSLLARLATAEAVGSGGKCCPHCPTRQLRETVANEPTFTMLAIIREFALEKLAASGELAYVMQRHALCFADWVEAAAAHLYGAEQGLWLARLERESDNLRAALSYLLQSDQLELAARMACALGILWQRHGRYREGRGWLLQVLEQMAHHPVPDKLRACVLQTAAMLAYRQGYWQAAEEELAESLALYRSTADRLGMAQVFFDQGWIALDQAKWDESIQLNRESLALAREANDQHGVYRALTNLGWTQLCLNHYDEAAGQFGEARQLAEQLGHTAGIATSKVNQAWIALYTGERRGAVRLVGRSLRLCHLLGEREVLAEGL
jgi:predicted ATPase